MSKPIEETPTGARPTEGILHRRSPYSVPETVEHLKRMIEEAGAKLFALVDHSGEAERVGLSLRDTKLLIFGNPKGGTPAMNAAPLVALDLPLKVLVWSDDSGAVWMSYLSGEWLARRHGVPAEIAKPLSAVEGLTSQAAISS